MAVLAAKAGRQLTPYLKALAGPWWLLAFELDRREPPQRRLPGLKQQEVLLFCRHEVRPPCTSTPPALATHCNTIPASPAAYAAVAELVGLPAQVLTHLEEAIQSRAEGLGLARAESSQELAERQQRVMAAALLGLASFAELMVAARAAAGASSGTADAAAAALQRCRCIVEKPGFFKLVLAHKRASLRRAAYAAFSQLAAGCARPLDASSAV